MMAMNILYTFKEFLVEADIIGMFRQDGTHLLSQSIHIIIGLCREEVEEYCADTTQQIIVVLSIFLIINIDDGIIEGRFLGIVNNLVDLLIITTDALHEGLLIVFQTDTVEWRRIVRCIIFFKKWVQSFLFTHNILLIRLAKLRKKFG